MTIPLAPADRPRGYPAEFERTLSLRDGSQLLVRPVVPADAATLADEIAHADSETLYLRFFTPSLRITRKRLRRLTELDYRHRFALAAFTPEGEGAGIARYEGAEDSAEAEVAVTIKPAHRRRGLATRLFELLEEAAVARGIDTFVANYLAENEGAESLLEACGYGPPSYEAGIATVTKRLTTSRAKTTER